MASSMISQSVKSFQIDCKRFYIKGLVVTTICPSCNQELIFDGNNDYLSYPDVNKTTNIHFYCNECDNKTSVKVKLKILVEED
jgi:hypothetical protein